MKSLGLILSYITEPLRKRNGRVVLWLIGTLVVLVAIYSTIFHVLMEREGQEHSWPTGIYWTMTVMSTLGFGDITFESDAGRVFSIVVLVSGALFILVLLPFAFIQFVFTPWMARREASRAPRRLPADIAGHIVLTSQDAITDAVIRRAESSKVPYVLIEPDLDEALRLHDRGYRVMVGDIDDPETYRNARVDAASLIAATRADTTNTNIAFTVREIDAEVPIVATAVHEASIDVLELAGCDHVLRLGELLGQAIARRVLARSGSAQVVGEFGTLLLAEASAAHTDLVGKTLRESELRQRVNVTVVGLWERGKYQAADPDAVIGANTVLILAGSAEQLAAYDRVYARGEDGENPVVIVGGGRVGRAAGARLREAGVPYKIIEQRTERIRDDTHYVLGDAAELEVLEQAGFRKASAVLVTTHDDDVNVYITLYCRRLQPDIQIISRANLDRNVSTLHRAGADAVLSYASLGASTIWNAVGLDDTLVLAEGLVAVRLRIPEQLVGKTLVEADIRRRTGCIVVALVGPDGMQTNPAVDVPLPAGIDLVLIGDSDSERRFLTRYPTDRRRITLLADLPAESRPFI